MQSLPVPWHEELPHWLFSPENPPGHRPGIFCFAAGQGKVIAANKFGKVKTTLQFITILFLLAGGAVTLNGDGVNELQLWFVIVGKVLLVATLAITIFSGYEYLVKNLDIFKDIKDKKEKKLK